MIPPLHGIPARRFPVVYAALIAANFGLGGPPRVVLPVRGERRLPRSTLVELDDASRRES